MRTARVRLPTHLLAVLILVSAGLCPAAAQLLGPEFQVNSFTTGVQYEPAVAAGESGEFVMAWASRAQDGYGLGVFAQRYDWEGLPVGSEIQVNTYTTGEQNLPAVAALASGDFVVVWASEHQDGSEYGIFGQRFDSTGLPSGGEFQISSYTMGSQHGPAAASGASGNFVVVWQSYGQDGSNWGVFAQLFDSSGLPVGSEFQVNSYASGPQWFPRVSADSSGNFVVVWEGYRQDGSGGSVIGRRFSASGLPLGSEFLVNTYTTSDQYSPAVAADSSGSFVVVWGSLQDGSDFGVFGQRFDSAGLPVGGEFQVNTYTNSDQWNPAVVVDASGRFVVVWDSFAQEGSDFGVFGQRFDATGVPMGGEFQVNSYTPRDQGLSALAAAGSGDFVVSWQSDMQDGSYDGVFGRKIRRFSIFSDGFDAGDACAWSVAVGGDRDCLP